MSEVFRVALAMHVIAGLTSVVSGVLAATARKRPGRHPTAGLVYLCGIAGVFGTAWVMSAIRWHRDWHLAVIATVAAGLASYGWLARRRELLHHHAMAMGGSLIALLTGFYVDNGPQLPLWRLLPHWVYWALPAAMGVPLIWWALRRFDAGVSSRPASPGGARRWRSRLRGVR
jgi:hypothetical protein